MGDARARITGTLDLATTHRTEGLLHAVAVRSPVPHARLEAVRTEAARRAHGVRAVLTGADLLARDGVDPYFGTDRRDQPILAIDRVRYEGEPVACVVADSPEAAREAALLVDVEYAELPAVQLPWDEGYGEAPPLHDDAPDGVCSSWYLRHGDPDDAWDDCDVILEGVYVSPSASHVPMEPHASTAWWDNGRLVVRSGTQAPYSVRASLAAVFGLPPEDVRVQVPNVGGAYGAKTTAKVEPLVACCALATGRPVHMALTREETFYTLSKHAARVALRTGVTRKGLLVARRIDVLWNAGAYTDTSATGAKLGLLRAAGPYRSPNIEIRSVAKYTNTVPSGPFRGAYTSQLCWAYESQVDEIAERLDLDPVEVRRRNLLHDGDPFATGEPVEDVHFTELLDEVARGIGWRGDRGRAPSGRPRGRGVAVMNKNMSAPSRSEVDLVLSPDGSVRVLTSSVEMGQGAHATLAALAAQQLGIEAGRVTVPPPDTDHAPYDLKTAGSRTTYTMGAAIADAATRLLEELRLLAARVCATDVGLVDVGGGEARGAGEPAWSLPYGEVLRRAGQERLSARGVYESEAGSLDANGQGVSTDHWHQGAAGIEVEVDTETGTLVITRCHVAAYAGKVVSPVRVRQQNEGGAIFALGQALFERLGYEGGHLLNPNLAEYMIPAIGDLPHALTSAALEHDGGAGGAHGVGEMVVPAIAPALANALRQAVGIRLRELPLSPEAVLAALAGHPEPVPEGESGEV